MAFKTNHRIVSCNFYCVHLPRTKNMIMHFSRSEYSLKFTGFGKRMARTSSPFAVEKPMMKTNFYFNMFIYTNMFQ